MAKVNAGDPLRIPAPEWNRHVDAADWALQQKASGKTPPSTGQRAYVKAKVFNNTGADRRRGDVVEIGACTLADLNPEYLWFDGETPTFSANRTAFGVLLQPVLNEKYVEALLLGICIAYVNVTNEDHKYADLDDGEHVLTSAVSGPVRILHKPTGTGEKECAVLLGDDGPLNFIGKAEEAIASGDSGTCGIWSGVPGSEADTTLDVEAFNKTEDIASGDWVSITRVGRYWYVAGLACPEGA